MTVFERPFLLAVVVLKGTYINGLSAVISIRLRYTYLFLFGIVTLLEDNDLDLDLFLYCSLPFAHGNGPTWTKRKEEGRGNGPFSSSSLAAHSVPTHQQKKVSRCVNSGCSHFEKESSCNETHEKNFVVLCKRRALSLVSFFLHKHTMKTKKYTPLPFLMPPGFSPPSW